MEDRFRKILIEYVRLILRNEGTTFLEYYDGDKTILDLTEEETSLLRLAAEEGRNKYHYND